MIDKDKLDKALPITVYEMAVGLLAEVKRLRKEVKVLSKYRDIVIEFDDALLADGDTDIRWSAIYDERVFE
jgi:hypothetical protein